MSEDKDRDKHKDKVKVKEIKKAPKGFSLLKLALFLFIVVLISGVALYSFMGINPADVLVEGVSGLYNRIFTVGTAELSETVKTLATYDASERPFCTTVSDDLVVATTSSVKIYDSEGREKAYIPVNLQKPYIEDCKKEILIADLEGRYFSLMVDDRLLWEKTIDEDIVNASISEDWILLITKSKQSGYKRTIRAYSKDGQEVSFRNVSNYYPFAAFYYPQFNKTSFIVNGIDTSGLETNGFFEFLDPSMNQKASIRGENEVFAGGIPLNEGRLFLYGEKSLILIDEGFNAIWEKKLTEFTVTAANVIKEKYPIVAELNKEILSNESRHETTIRVLNGDSSERAKLTIDEEVTGISTSGSTAAIRAGSEVFFINLNGEIMDRYTAKSDVSAVYLAREDLAYVISEDTVSRVNVKISHKFLGIF